MSQIDFTKMRSSGKIKKCPKCGRKGLYTHGTKPFPDRNLYDTYDHIAEDIGFALEIKERCSIKQEAGSSAGKQKAKGKK